PGALEVGLRLRIGLVHNGKLDDIGDTQVVAFLFHTIRKLGSAKLRIGSFITGDGIAKVLIGADYIGPDLNFRLLGIEFGIFVNGAGLGCLAARQQPTVNGDTQTYPVAKLAVVVTELRSE